MSSSSCLNTSLGFHHRLSLYPKSESELGQIIPRHNPDKVSSPLKICSGRIRSGLG